MPTLDLISRYLEAKNDYDYFVLNLSTGLNLFTQKLERTIDSKKIPELIIFFVEMISRKIF